MEYFYYVFAGDKSWGPMNEARALAMYEKIENKLFELFPQANEGQGMVAVLYSTESNKEDALRLYSPFSVGGTATRREDDTYRGTWRLEGGR